MKLKKEYLILVLVIAGLSAYLVMRKTDHTLYQLPRIFSLDRDQISKVEISKGDNLIVVKKKDNRWYIDPVGYSADPERVKSMLDVLEAFTLTALVSESKDYTRYDLHDEKRIAVKAWQGQTIMRDFKIGKAAPSFRHTFVRLSDDDRVFHARDSFRGKFDLTVDSLRDRRVLSFKTTDIQEIQIADNQTSLKLARTQTPVEPAASEQEKSDSTSPLAVKFGWQSPQGKKGDDAGLNRLLTTLSSLRCEKFIDDRKKEDFTTPLYTVKLKGAQDHDLSIFAKLKEDDPNYPATSSGSSYPFYLSTSNAQRIMKAPQEMLQKLETDQQESEPETPPSKQ
jgi:hypothetical protein